MTYIHELTAWPDFTWDYASIAEPLARARHRQGRLFGRMESLGMHLRSSALLDTLTQDVLKTSEIEGEFLEPMQVRSSLAQRLGIDIGGLTPPDRNVDGVVEMLLDATQNFALPLTHDRLFGWHAALFPTGRSGMSRIIVGAWRDDRIGPMQVVSGPIGKERVHYQAPRAARLEKEMTAFLHWFNAESPLDPVVKAALAHLWFVTIHPFDDGNGRIARAVADMVLARSEQSAQRFYSMSSQIRAERKAYYDVLELTQSNGLDITPWLEWFLACLDRAIAGAESTLARVLEKARFWESEEHQALNERQRKVINLILDGVEEKLSSSKWARITHTSTDSALRDINALVSLGVLTREEAGGRSTGYVLKSRQ